jgi:transcriptional regulator with XRE-family HTH domain
MNRTTRQETTAKIIGGNVRAELARKGRTQTAAAHLLGLPQSAISRRMNGGTAWEIDELLALATWLDVPVTTFLDGLPRMDSNHQPAGYLAQVLAPAADPFLELTAA